MSGKLFDHEAITEQIRTEIKKTLLPDHTTAVLNLVNSLVNEIPVPQEVFTGKSITEATQALDRFRIDTASTIAQTIRAEFMTALAETPSWHHSTALNKVSERIVQHEPMPEASDTPEPDEADDNTIAAPTPAKPKHMPMATIRQIIKDRVEDHIIEKVLELADAGQKPSEIRAAGIGLDEQIIQVIINDRPATHKPPTEEEIALQQQKEREYQQRAVKRYYKQGYTVEYIAANLEMTEDQVRELLPEEFTVEQVELTEMTKQIIENHKTLGDSADDVEAYSFYNLRPEVIQHALNGA